MPRLTPRALSITLVVTTSASFGFAAPPKAPAASPPAAATPRAAAADTSPANGLATGDELHQSFADGNYKETLQKLSRVLALKGEAAKAYDRHDLLVLKAETQLKLKDAVAAAAAFDQASKEAPDDKAKAVDTATQMVVKRSKNLVYTPAPKKGAKAGDKPAPIDVADPEKRKDAFAALLAEQKDEVAPKVKAARDATTLQPVVEALQAAAGLRTLELAATGEDAQVKAMTQALSDHAQKMMADAVEDMTKTVDDIEKSANDLVPIAMPVRSSIRGPGLPGGGGASVEHSYKKKGLMTPDVRDLNRVISDCKKLVPASKELAEKLGESGEPFKDIGKNAMDVGNKAHKVLTTDYANSYTRSPRMDRGR